MGRLRHPTVVLVAGAGQIDSDGMVAGIPILSQLAGALAEQGYLVVRYDKRAWARAAGAARQSRSATTRTISSPSSNGSAKRDDVDDRQIAVAGHGEGGMIAMLAADREKKIGELVLMSTRGSTGAELILAQQLRALEGMNLPEAEKAQKIALQKQIQSAVVSGNGMGHAAGRRSKAGRYTVVPSLLMFDPAEDAAKIKQPILIVQGDLDTQVPPAHAEKLAELARARKKGAGPVEVVHIARREPHARTRRDR